MGGLGITLFTGFKWYSLNSKPDLQDLVNKTSLVQSLTEVIIPDNNLPGAKKANIGRDVIRLIANSEDVRTQNKFLSGLLELEDECKGKYGRPFSECSANQKLIILQSFETKRGNSLVDKGIRRYFGVPFFETLRDYTSIAYCTSEVGATKALSYVLVPGKYEGCVALEKNQSSWATE